MLPLMCVSLQGKKYPQYSRLEDHCTNNTPQELVHKGGLRIRSECLDSIPDFFLLSSCFSCFASRIGKSEPLTLLPFHEAI